jgi:hypothetical protein
MREHIKKVGAGKLAVLYLLVLATVVVIEIFATYNLQMIDEIRDSARILRELFSTIAIIVAAFTVIANVVFVGGKTKADREFHYYFRTRPLWVYSATAIIGDIVAIFLAHNTGYAYTVFFTSLIAVNIISIAFALHSAEKAISKGT